MSLSDGLIAGTEILGVILTIMAMWARLSSRIARLEAELAAVRETLRRIEDAVWAQAGIAVLPERPSRGA